jgi:hypothetical protein
MSGQTTIRRLMKLREEASRRSNAVEALTDREVQPLASRVWSRQGNAIVIAIIAEPPTSAEDALSVLCCLAELRDQNKIADEDSPHSSRDMAEMTDVAIHNCIAALAGNITPSADLLPTQDQDIAWSVRYARRWLPTPRKEGC